jgi:hypothetical protein
MNVSKERERKSAVDGTTDQSCNDCGREKCRRQYVKDMTVPGFISSYVDVEGRRGDEAQADKGKQQLMMEDLMEDEGLIKYLMNCFVGSYWEVRR